MNILSRILQTIKSRSEADIQARDEIQKVLALPFDQVKQHALELLADPKRFICVTGKLTDNPMIENLGPVLRDFFLRFESVAEANGDFSVGRRTVENSKLRPGFLKIGSDFANSELIVKPGGDHVFIVTDAEHRLDGLPTIYHNIYLLE